jgi:hypothetical protein
MFDVRRYFPATWAVFAPAPLSLSGPRVSMSQRANAITTEMAEDGGKNDDSSIRGHWKLEVRT